MLCWCRIEGGNDLNSTLRDGFATAVVMAQRGKQQRSEKQRTLMLLVDSDAQDDTRHDSSSVSTSWSSSLSTPSLHVAMRETPAFVHSSHPEGGTSRRNSNGSLVRFPLRNRSYGTLTRTMSLATQSDTIVAAPPSLANTTLAVQSGSGVDAVPSVHSDTPLPRSLRGLRPHSTSACHGISSTDTLSGSCWIVSSSREHCGCHEGRGRVGSVSSMHSIVDHFISVDFAPRMHVICPTAPCIYKPHLASPCTVMMHRVFVPSCQRTQHRASP